MMKAMERISVLLVGGILYGLIEILWRGYTHWTMVLVGGVAFLLIYILNERMVGRSLWLRCLVGAAVITAIEFAAGVVVNLIFRLDVWDYSGMSFNLLGQVCLFFSCMWYALCVPAFPLSTLLRKFFIKIENNSGTETAAPLIDNTKTA